MCRAVPTNPTNLLPHVVAKAAAAAPSPPRRPREAKKLAGSVGDVAPSAHDLVARASITSSSCGSRWSVPESASVSRADSGSSNLAVVRDQMTWRVRSVSLRSELSVS